MSESCENAGIPAGWRIAPLRDFTDRVTYGFTNPMPTTTNGPFMLTAKDIRLGRIDYASARHTSNEAYENAITDKSRPRVGDVLLTKDGSIGRVAVCDREYVCINQSVAVLRPSSEISSKFLSYLLQAPHYQRKMESDADGSTIKHIYITRVDKMSIAVPPIDEQQAVVGMLGALDDKMAVNAEVTRIADALARTKFEHLLADSEAIPLTDAARFVNGKAFTKGASGAGRVVIRIAELNSGLGGSTVYNDIDVADQQLARPGDLLFAWSGSLTLHRWFRPEAIVNQHIFKVIPKDGYPIWCAHGLIARKLDEFKAIAADKATTMGHIQRRHLEELVDVPARAALERNDDAMTALWNRALLAEQESLTLVSVRDALLPQLMSGKIRVKDAKKSVEEVL